MILTSSCSVISLFFCPPRFEIFCATILNSIYCRILSSSFSRLIVEKVFLMMSLLLLPRFRRYSCLFTRSSFCFFMMSILSVIFSSRVGPSLYRSTKKSKSHWFQCLLSRFWSLRIWPSFSPLRKAITFFLSRKKSRIFAQCQQVDIRSVLNCLTLESVLGNTCSVC